MSLEKRARKRRVAMDKLRNKLESGVAALGTHVSLNDPAITEIMGYFPYDYIWIDTEHTSISLECLQSHLIAARASGVSSVVRIPSVDRIKAKPILEMGPDGVVFPQVNSYEIAMEAIEACMYPPQGVRGYGPRRQSRYGLIPAAEYFSHANDDILRFLQFENIAAYDDLDRILAIKEMDALIIGPCDLAASMGHIGDWDNKEVVEVIDEVCRRAHEKGARIGVSYGYCDLDRMKEWKDRGVDMISIAADTDYILNGAAAVYGNLRKAFG